MSPRRRGTRRDAKLQHVETEVGNVQPDVGGHGDTDEVVTDQRIANSELAVIVEDVTTEQPAKRMKTDFLREESELEKVEQKAYEERRVYGSHDVKQLLFGLHSSVCNRLEKIESSLDMIALKCHYVDQKLVHIYESVAEMPLIVYPSSSVQDSMRKPARMVAPPKKRAAPVIIGLPQRNEPEVSVGVDSEGRMYHESAEISGGVRGSMQPAMTSKLASNIALITLNSEADFPNGSWLGEENNPECRVRCFIRPGELETINVLTSPEKMALALLDAIFDRDTLAISNISGISKYGKKQLDPLMIYGIRCHLLYMFNINEEDWHRIKLNIDSKCRTAFRRKRKGLPASPYKERSRQSFHVLLTEQNQEKPAPDTGGESSNDGLEIERDEALLLPQGEGEDQLQDGTIVEANGQMLQVFHATPEQIAQLQQSTQHIQILGEDGTTQVIQLTQDTEGLGVDGSDPDDTHMVTVHVPDEHDEDTNVESSNVVDGT